MKGIVICLLLSFVYIRQIDKQLNVATRTMAQRIRPGFPLKSEDSILVYNGSRYLVLKKEYFDEKGEITRAIFNHDIAYLEWSKNEILKFKNFFEENEIEQFIMVTLIDRKRLKINEKMTWIKSIESNKKAIFYSLKGETNTIHQIVFR